MAEKSPLREFLELRFRATQVRGQTFLSYNASEDCPPNTNPAKPFIFGVRFRRDKDLSRPVKSVQQCVIASQIFAIERPMWEKTVQVIDINGLPASHPSTFQLSRVNSLDTSYSLVVVGRKFYQKR
jgi:hypothetical protein